MLTALLECIKCGGGQYRNVYIVVSSHNVAATFFHLVLCTVLPLELEEDIHKLLRLTNSRAKPIQYTVSINKKLITMELDTGVSSSIISQQTFAQIGHMRKL